MESAMEQTRYWMWERSRSFSNRPNKFSLALATPPAPPSFDSWEEAAFAKDSAGDLWGCVWPPRSYTCSFCCREFRSAQALGGHMNVHRRDRARLKQEASSSSNSDESPNPNPNPNSQAAASFSLHTQEICSRNMLLASPFPVTPQSLTEVSIDLKLGERDCRRRDDESSSSSYKKLKSNDGLALGLSRKSTDHKPEHHLPPLKSEVLNLRTCQVEELDLELRLGEPPKVKQSCSIIVIE